MSRHSHARVWVAVAKRQLSLYLYLSLTFFLCLTIFARPAHKVIYSGITVAYNKPLFILPSRGTSWNRFYRDLMDPLFKVQPIVK